MTSPPLPPPGTPISGYAVPSRYAVSPGYPYPVRAPVPPPPPVAPGGAPLAEAWQRLVAYLIDVLIIGLVLLIPGVALLVFLVPRYLDALREAGNGGHPDFGSLMAIYLVGLLGLFVLQYLAYFCYEVLFMHRTGQTVGKRVMGIKVVRATDGGDIDRPTARRRWLVQFGTMPVAPYFFYADVLWQLWDKPMRQCLHDKYAQTVVVRMKR